MCRRFAVLMLVIVCVVVPSGWASGQKPGCGLGASIGACAYWENQSFPDGGGNGIGVFARYANEDRVSLILGVRGGDADEEGQRDLLEVYGEIRRTFAAGHLGSYQFLGFRAGWASMKSNWLNDLNKMESIGTGYLVGATAGIGWEVASWLDLDVPVGLYWVSMKSSVGKGTITRNNETTTYVTGGPSESSGTVLRIDVGPVIKF
jgi:hypothetical protein